MRIKSIVLVILGSVLSLAADSVYSQDVSQILTKARGAVKNLNTVKTKGKTITDSAYTVKNEGVLDYGNKRFSIVQSQDGMTVSAIYLIDNTTYMYNVMLKSWIKFGEDLDIFSGILNKDMTFLVFPAELESTGFKVDIIGEEEIEGQACYVLQSSVVDEGLAKEFITKLLDKFTSEQNAINLKKNKELIDKYIEQHIKSSAFTQWISKDNFLAVKVVNKYSQENNSGVLVTVENEAIYYDFNQPVKIELPEDAKNAKLVTAEDMGLGK